MNKDLLITVCERFLAPTNIEVVVKDPYIPYIPENWNGIIVLGEAQNLSNTYKSYVDQLKGMSQLQKFFRLSNPDNLGIMPWDNGSLKLAVEAALQESSSETAVSNAVLWSQTNTNGTTNRNPVKELEIYASGFWADLLHILKPNHIVASGAIAHRVIDKTKWTGKVTKLIHPSSIRFMKANSGEDELLLRYPIVKTVIDRHPDWVNRFRFSKIRFACKAIEIVKEDQAQFA